MLLIPYSSLHTPYSLLHTPYSILPTPYSLLLTPHSSMTYTPVKPEVFLSQIEPFNRLSTSTQLKLAKIGQYYRYHVGQPIALRDRLSAQVNIVVEEIGRAHV